ncbi:hypothetical protein FHG87_022474 [Trinorchestia longiramus]|nr:hypothetical protein FHG87_022474 [Trinorchestia longiramus]
MTCPSLTSRLHHAPPDLHAPQYSTHIGGGDAVCTCVFCIITKKYKCLGCMLSEDRCARAKGEKVVKAMQWWGRLSSVVKYRANKYECVRGIWKYVAVSSILFCMNVMAWNGGDLEKLEVLQNRVGRVALSAPKWTAAEALRGDLGWSVFSERMAKAVLNYKVRIERMRNKRRVKQIFEWNLSESLIYWSMQEN